MTALAAPRPTPTLETGKNVWRTFPVAADVIIYPGAQVALNAAGNLVPATASTALVAAGIAVPKRHQMTRLLGYIDSTGLAAAAMECEVQSCIALMVNSSSLITKAEVGDDCFMVDDQTVHKTDGGVAQITVATVVYDAGAATGFTITGVVPTITVTAATDATATALALANAANARGDFSALYTAVALAETITITKRTSGVFTLTKQVGGAADITQATDPAGVAPTRSKAGKIHDIDTRGVWVDYAA